MLRNNSPTFLEDSTQLFGDRQIESVFYWLSYFLLLFRKTEISGVEYIPKYGGLLLAMEHRSIFDPFFIKFAINRAQPDRQVYGMAKIELFTNSWMNKILVGMRTFPVDRAKPSVESFKTSKRILNEKHILGIFPQGTRNGTTIHKGVWYLAGNRSNPDEYGIVIVSVRFVPRWFWFSDVHIAFDPVVSQSNFKDCNEFSNYLATRWGLPKQS